MAVNAVPWGVEQPLDPDDLATASARISLLHRMSTRWHEAIIQNGYIRAPGPLFAIMYMSHGRPWGRMEGMVVPIAPADDVVPL